MITLEQKNHYMRHEVAVLTEILKTYKPSEENLKCEPGNPMFEDSCNFQGLHHAVFEFVQTMKTLIKYNEIIIKSEKKELE